MKRILTYSLFESDEYDDEAPEGFVYSEIEVVDFLGDLIDNLDFEIEKYSNISMIKKLYLDEEFHDVGGLDKLSQCVWTGFEVNLIKPVFEKTDFIWREIGSYPRKTIYLNSSLFEVDVYSELKTILPRFEKYFHNLRCTSDGYQLRLVLLNKVVEGEKLQRIQKIKEDKAYDKISRRFDSFYRAIKETRTLSPIFKKGMFLNKVGESGYGFKGAIAGGFVILPINTSKLSKVVVKNNLPKVESFLSGLAFSYITKKEFRIITENDLKELLSAYKKVHPDSDYYTLDGLKERYEGLYGFIIKFDYNRWFNDKMKEE
jgi:hypothetical protein